MNEQSFCITIKNNIVEMQQVLLLITSFCEELNIPKLEMNRILVVADEILSNIIQYSFDQGEHTITISGRKFSNSLELEFVDDGIYFDTPRYLQHFDNSAPLHSDPIIGGLGLKIVNEFMDTIHYFRKENTNFLKLMIAFNSKPS